MATAAEIANDLRARARVWDGRHDQGRMLTSDAQALRRAADMIEAQAAALREFVSHAEAGV